MDFGYVIGGVSLIVIGCVLVSWARDGGGWFLAIMQRGAAGGGIRADKESVLKGVLVGFGLIALGAYSIYWGVFGVKEAAKTQARPYYMDAPEETPVRKSWP